MASMMKKFVADELLPVLLDLRLVLQSAQSAQGRNLTDALFSLLREHKSEVRKALPACLSAGGKNGTNVPCSLLHEVCGLL